MKEQFSRTAMLLGEEAVQKLQESCVAVFGLGGVGSYCVEALARSGVGKLVLIDHDTVAESNLNRQLFALRDTIGRKKTEAARERIAQINPDCIVEVRDVFFLPETKDSFEFSAYDYVADAIDTVSGKLQLIECAKEAGVPVISAMGAGNKLDASKFEVADISETSVCPLAKIMRRELRKRGISGVKCVYSKEEPLKPDEALNSEISQRRSTPGSVAFVPSVMGLLMAGEIVKDLIGWKEEV
ncbi:MAG: tRNA threonylcarbamoyladenosine dehydratase [Lachnospiraceae bacterium]|nr:tRNA threonylcarbamoyladenosine dehydratase [Lachnospiraceae bacterium]